MKPLSGLYRPLVSLLKYPVVYQHHYPEYFYTLQIRPFSIMVDIATLYTWINRPRMLSSGHVIPYQRNLLKYYKSILESSDSQAFMVLQDNQPVCQVDLIPAAYEPLHAPFAKGVDDVSVRYIADFRTPHDVLLNSIHLCLNYLFSFSGNPVAYINMPAMDMLHGKNFGLIGCDFLDTVTYEDQIIKVYACRKGKLKAQ